MNIKRWAVGLWGFVQDNLIEGRPFFLCIDDLALQRIGREMSVEFGDASAAEEDFLLACLTKMEVTHDRVRIDPLAFERGSNDRSLSICFAAQQVLAAERMIDDADGSRDAYYARYRQVLGLNPHGIGSPLPYWHFSMIWSTYRSELLSVAAASESSITFRPGTGKNKYRALPMSQALLDLESLRTIHERIKNLGRLSDEDLIHRVRRISRLLSKRCADKVYLEVIRSALLDQIRSFVLESTSPAASGEKKPRARIDPAIFFIYIEDDGWEDVYRLGVRSTDVNQDSTADLAKALTTHFGRRNLLGFREGTTSDFEGLAEIPDDLNDLALIVVPISASHELEPDWFQHFEEVACCAIPEGYRMLLRRQSISSQLTKTQEKESEIGLQFFGGIVVDRSRKAYLAGLPPTSIYLAGELLGESDMLTVNGDSVSVGEFIERLRDCRGAVDFHVVSGEYQSYLGIVTTRDREPLDVGFPIREGYCSATAMELGGDYAIRYLGLSSEIARRAGIDRRTKRGDLIKHLSLPSDQWVPAEAQTVDAVLAVVERERPSSSFHERQIAEIRKNRSIPVTLLKLYQSVLRETG